MTIYQFFEDLEVGLADTIFSRNSDGQYSLVAQQNGYPTDTKFATFAKGNGGGATDDDTNTVDSDDDEVQLLKLDNDQQQRYITVLSNCEYDEELAKPSVSWNQTHVDLFLAYIASGSTPATAVKKVVEDINKSTTTAGGDGLDAVSPTSPRRPKRMKSYKIWTTTKKISSTPLLLSQLQKRWTRLKKWSSLFKLAKKQSLRHSCPVCRKAARKRMQRRKI